MTLAPEGRKMLRIEQRNAATPVERKPEWIKAKVQMGPEFVQLKNLVKKEGLHTVCEEAGCPNIFECWEDKEATFLIGGSECTRRCDFCQIDTGKPSPVDMFEPTKVARSVQAMQLRYATVTGVARDDLADEGVWLYAETVRKIHELNPGTGVELLIPDFSGKPEHIAAICDSKPEVFAHNVETVPRIFKRIRPAFRYDRSLDVITQGRKLGHGDQVQPDPGHGRDPRGDLRGAAGPARGRLRPDHHHPVPAPVRAAPAGGPLGQAAGIRGPAARGRRDRLPRRHVRAAGALLLPRRPALGHRDAQEGLGNPGRARPHRNSGSTRQEAASLLAAALLNRPEHVQGPPGCRTVPVSGAARERPVRHDRINTMANPHRFRCSEARPLSPASPRREAAKPTSSPSRLKQIGEVFQMTRRNDPMVSGSCCWPSSASSPSASVGFLLDNWITGLIIGIPLGVLAATFILSRRAERAAFAQIENQPGASGAALGTLRRGWILEDQPVAVNPRTQDAGLPRHRPARRRAGQRGPSHRVQAAGRRRAQAAAPHPAQRHHPRDRKRPRRGPGGAEPGRQDGEKAQEGTDQDEVSAVYKRLPALGSRKLPIPKGIDPYKARPDRKAVRGR